MNLIDFIEVSIRIMICHILEKIVKKICFRSTSFVVVLQCKWFLAFLARNGLIFLASREKWKTGEMCISTYDFYNWILVSTSFCKLLEIWTSRTSFHISIALVDCQSPWDNSFFLFYLQIAHFLWHFCLLAVDGDSTKVLQDSTKTQTQNEMVFL